MLPQKVLLLAVFLVSLQSAEAQQSLPLIRANASTADIKEDGILMKGIWNITPGVKPDVYNIMKSRKEKRVTFYTDLDSISFDVKPGLVYDFIILKDKDSCFTQIRTVNSPNISYKKDHDAAVSDTIAFTLEDNFIHLKGKLNNSKSLDLIFDSGAGSVVVTEKGLKDTNLKLDGTTENIGSGGSTKVKTSSLNKLEISNLQWDSLLVLSIDYKGHLHADGIVGSNVFEGKAVEINYDRKIMIIHNFPLKIEDGYFKTEMKYRTGQPFIALTLVDGGKRSTGWFLFDTGSKFSLSANREFVASHHLDETMESIGTRSGKGTDGTAIKNETVLLPKLMIGGHVLSHLPIDLEKPSEKGGLQFGIVGNDILKRFNTIIDYQNGFIYLKPNQLLNTPYDKPFNLKKK